MPGWTRSTPVFPVADVEASIVWYGDLFGFVPAHVNRDPKGKVPTNYAVLRRDPEPAETADAQADPPPKQD